MLGQILSHYRILEQIGQGGMGVVYKALDLHLDRFVAVKTLPKEKVADSERRQRFIQEAKSASALNHPNIVTIYDIDEANGNYFIAMEYIQGKTLHELIRNKELPLEKSLDYGIQIADALTKAHSAGIVHRDIKPSNVMITSDHHAKVLDFGLAKLAEWPEETPTPGQDDRTPSLAKLTEEGAVLGTLSYMSPEQARGRPVDHRTDIFSLGVMLYQMVSGELPFRGPHTAAILDKLLYSPTPSIRSSDPSYPDSLERTISRAMAKDPRDRYQSMQEMASDLRAVASGQTVAHPLLNQRRRRSLLVVVAAVVLILLIVLPLREHLQRWLRGPTVGDAIVLAVLPIVDLDKDKENQSLCDGLTERFVTKFAQLESFGKSLGIISSREVRERGVTSPAAARSILGASLVLEGSLEKIRDIIKLNINLVETKSSRLVDGKICEAAIGDLPELEEDAFEQTLAMLAVKLNPQEEQVLSAGSTRDSEAYNSYLQGLGLMSRFDIGENIDQAIRYFQESIAVDPGFALAHAGLGEAYWRKYARTRDQQWADEALSSSQRAAELDSRIAAVYITQGTIYTGTGDLENAVEVLKQAIDLEPRNATAYRELGYAFERMDKKEESETAYRKAIELKPNDWYIYFSFGLFYYHRSLYEEAAAQFQKVIELHPDHYYAYSALGGIRLYQGDFKEAEELFARSLAIRETPEAYSNLSASYILQGRAPEAVPLMEKAVEMEGVNHEVWSVLADACSLTPGLSERAQSAYKRAAEMVSRDLEVDPSNDEWRAMLAYYLIRSGNETRSLEIINRVMDSRSKSSNILFWSALVYERAGDRERALETLAAAAEAGYSPAVIRAASDLDELRKDPRYRDLIASQWSN